MNTVVEAPTPLEQAVEDAYRLFEAEPPGHWSGDDMGVGKEDWARLTNVPLRELNRFDTNYFLSETNKPTRREVRYMLPRLLEILATGDAPTVIAVECSLDCLGRAGYPVEWTDADCELIERFFHELLRAYCADPLAFRPEQAIGGDLDGYLCMIGCAGGDVPAALKVLEGVPKQQLDRALALWIGPWNTDPPWQLGLYNAFWDSAPISHEKTIRDWLEALDPPRFLEAAFFAETDPEWQEVLSDGQQSTSSWRRDE